MDFNCLPKIYVLEAWSPAWHYWGGGINFKMWGLVGGNLVNEGTLLKGKSETPATFLFLFSVS
jgi:hypothetical protein